MKSFIPNLLTLANLGCGLLAIQAIFAEHLVWAAWLIGFSLIFDFLDGFAARLLRVHSELGKQLDSLADLVSFGVVPGFLVFQVIQMDNGSNMVFRQMLAYIALVIPLMSALRLAKFNLDTRQADYFIGLPTPANTIFWFSMILTGIYSESAAVRSLLINPFWLAGLSILTAILLITELPLMSLKAKNLRWRDNAGRYVLLISILLLLLIFGFRATAFIIPLYLLLSLIFKPNSKKQ